LIIDNQIGKKPIVFIIVTVAWFFLSHRLKIAQALSECGFDVRIVTADGPDVKKITDLGFKHYVVPFTRSGQNIFGELYVLVSLIKLFKRTTPDIVHLVSIKPVILAGIAARLVGIKYVVGAISGLGTVFLTTSIFARCRKWFLVKIYRFVLNKDNTVSIFQNVDDLNDFINFEICKRETSELIMGSGVSLKDYTYSSEPEDTFEVIMASRMLKDKGVYDFVEAAKILSKRKVPIKFKLVGFVDEDNLSSVSQRELEVWKKEKLIDAPGYQTDIAAQYTASNLVCLPSYREGLPKALIEAAACGRAVVTTDVPGCRHAIKPGVTGLLVPAKDPVALANAIQFLYENTKVRKEMGRLGRKLAEIEFSDEKIIAEHINIYRNIRKMI
jgi:glycosyltransferase involved in cell wall biosynthesis